MDILRFIGRARRGYNAIKRWQRQIDALAPKPSAASRPRPGVKSPSRRDWSHLKQGMYHHQQGQCAGCRSRIPIHRMEIDHYLPISQGGADAPHNLQLLCRGCNREKGASAISNSELYSRVWR